MGMFEDEMMKSHAAFPKGLKKAVKWGLDKIVPEEAINTAVRSADDVAYKLGQPDNESIPDAVRHAVLMREVANYYYGMMPEDLSEEDKRAVAGFAAKMVGYGNEVKGAARMVGSAIKHAEMPDFQEEYKSMVMDLNNNGVAVRDWQNNPIQALDDYIWNRVVKNSKFNANPDFGEDFLKDFLYRTAK